MNKSPDNFFKNKYNLSLKENTHFFTKEHHWLPIKLGIRYFAFGQTLYCDRDIPKIPAHEFLHIAQFHKYGIIGVLVHYLYYFAKNYFSSFDLANSFVNIPFEVEARAFEEARKG